MSRMPDRIFAYEETFNGKNRKTGWVQVVPTPGICNPVEYVRADIYAKELTALAIESKDRELVLARLEAEVMAIKKEWEQKNR